MRKFMRMLLAIAILPLSLVACGGGSSGNGNGSSSSPVPDTSAPSAESVVLSGQVVDGPIAGAQVCLYSDGVQARDAAGAAICSSATDTQGNYTMTIPRTLAPGFITLVASKENIKLVSSLGTLSQVLSAAGSSAVLNAAALPPARISQFTTADFVLADVNNDGIVTKSEFDGYVSDYIKLRKVAAVIKAAIDFGQAAYLIGGKTGNTLLLASAAAQNQTLGTTSQTVDQWAADPANATVMSATDQDVATNIPGGFSNYKLSTIVTSYNIPPKVTAKDGAASIGCEINTANESVTVQIAIDAARGVIVLKHDNVQTVGSYNARNGAVSLTEPDPLSVAMVNADVTYYSEGFFKFNGTYDASTGKVTGSYSELSANTWTINAARVACTAEGTLTATRL
jgi:hypothetical protein